MAFHVRDPETDALVRAFARSRGIGITEAIREAVQESAARDARRRGASLWERTADLRAKLETFPRTGLKADKQFFDELSGQGDE